MSLTSPMASHENTFNGLYEFMNGSSSKSVTILPCLIAISLVQVEI